MLKRIVNFFRYRAASNNDWAEAYERALKKSK